MAKSKKELEQDAVEHAAEGLGDMAQAEDKLKTAEDVAAVGKAAEAAGVSDLTRAMDAEIVAGRMAQLSQTVSAAGARYCRRRGNDHGL
jgi:hypothetical protein